MFCRSTGKHRHPLGDRLDLRAFSHARLGEGSSLLQLRSSSLMLVLERVCASTRLTMMAA